MRALRALKLPAIILVLAMSIAAPVVIAGYRNLGVAESAEAARQYSISAEHYESAARQLAWIGGLWEKAGMAAYDSGDSNDAVRLLRIAVQRESISAQGWGALGSALWSQAKYDPAILAWNEGLHANPRDLELLDHLASAYHQVADYGAEHETLTRRLAVSGDALSHYRLGMLLMFSDPTAARTEIQAAAVLNREFDPAASSLLAALEAASRQTDSAKQFVLVGRGLGLVEEWGLASMAFKRALEADPGNAEAWAWHGEALQHLGAEGRPDLDRALSLDSHDSLVRVLRGLYWRRQGNNPQALLEYLAAVQIEPTNPVLQSSLGAAYTASGDLVAALRAYQEATTLAPDDATYWRLLAMFSADNGVQTSDVGLPAAQKAAQLAPLDPQVLDTLGWSYAAAGFPYEGQQRLQQAISKSPDMVMAHLHLAEVYLRIGAAASALDELNLCRQLDPTGTAGQIAAQLLSRYFP